MPDLKTTQENVRTSIDGTELVRLATTGANWQASLDSIFLQSSTLTEIITTGENYLTISGTSINASSVNLAGTNVTGNLTVTHLNSGTNATSTSFWSGNGTWQVPTGGGSGGGMAIGAPISGGAGLNGVLYDDGAVTLQEAANFQIDPGTGCGNIVSGATLEYDGNPVIAAQPAQFNFWDGGAGNLTNTGSYNTGTGVAALGGLTTGSKNAAIGYFAGHGIAAGTTNLCIGYFAGLGMEGSGNFALGASTLQSDTNASLNTAIGSFNMSNGTGAVACVAIGISCLGSYSNPSNDIAIGNSIFGGTVTGTNDIGIGATVFGQLTSGNYNIGIGLNVIPNITTGVDNIGIGGRNVFPSLVSGDSQNVGLGSYCAFSLSGSKNIIIGYAPAFNLASGSSNIIIGADPAGVNMTSGSNNVLIGGHAGVATGTGNFILSDGGGTLLLDYGMTIASVWKFAAPIALSNAFVTTSILATGYVTIQDSNGSSYKLLAA